MKSLFKDVFTTFGIPEENQSLEHLVRKSNLHGDSLLSSDLNLRIGITGVKFRYMGFMTFMDFSLEGGKSISGASSSKQ